MRKLVVIGNGFDIHHKLDTKYVSFGLFLQKKYPTIYDHLTDYYGFTDISNDENSDHLMWNEFEESLALLDADTILDAHSDSLARPSSAGFRDRDWGTFAIDIEMIVEELTVNLFKAFKEFILNVDYPEIDSIKDKLLPLCKNDLYLTFNYTDTLERYYGIPRENIIYIHEKASADEQTIVLGHGINPDNFKNKSQKPPKNLSEEDLEHWYDEMINNYDHSYEMGKDEMHKYFIASFKETKAIIENYSSFFKYLKEIKEVTILGHSLATVDLPYFIEIRESIHEDTLWQASYYGIHEKHEHQSALASINIPRKNIELAMIEGLFD